MVGAAFTSIPAPAKAAEAAKNDEVKITLLGTSDIHGRFMPWDYSTDAANNTGSLTQLLTIIKKVRAENPNTILLDAGDSIQGNSAELFNDQPQSPMMVAMNEMGYDAWALGNHEFNFGLDTLEKISSQYKGPILAGNIYKENGERFLPASTVIERAGVKIGVIGMDTPMTAEFEKGTDHVNGIVFTNPVDETKKAIKELEGKVDATIGLMHMGLENENGRPGTGVADIANGNPELTAIFAGHMHKLVKKEEVNGVLITEPDKYGTHISRIDLTFVKENGKMVLKSKEATALPVKQADGSFTTSDADLEKKLHPFHEHARADANIVVAELKGMNLVPKNEIEGIPQVQIQETRLADFFNDVMLHYSKADVVAHQIDNDKARLDIGAIKKKDIAYNYQYALGEITNYRVTGKDLKDYMEWSAGYFNSTRPGDVTISFDNKRRASKYSTNDFFGGVKYEIDLTKPYGDRITNVRKHDGTPIKPEDKLTLGMNAYRMEFLQAKGGALEGRKFEQLWSSKDESAYGETEGIIRNLAIKYLKEEKNGVYEPKVQDNWKVLGIDTAAPERADVVELINKGILGVPKTEDGKFTNVASINIKDAVTKEMIEELAKNAKLAPEQFAGVQTTGELYSKVNAALKAAGTGTEDKKPVDDKKPVEETKPVEKPVTEPVVEKPEASKQGVVTASFLNVRAGASYDAKVFASVPKGTVLEVLGMEKGWLKISFNGKIAYVGPSHVTVQ
ncbi:5'-nucleotidase C-terminal domain-containing protein [Paenibacillus sp. N1-5-1-14]|nr:5'-nucleotidase C-terminal domain-containing protein [Paenibacillus radicibacter]MCR8645279.1 5'-nucleotidase C-terminal domain-containing protein [Paenibacillus radicibacter]